MRYSTILMCSLVFAVLACSSVKWVHPYKKEDQFVYDYNKCDRMVFQSQTVRPTVGYTPYVQTSLLEKCLKQEGWVKVQTE